MSKGKSFLNLKLERKLARLDDESSDSLDDKSSDSLDDKSIDEDIWQSSSSEGSSSFHPNDRKTLDLLLLVLSMVKHAGMIFPKPFESLLLWASLLLVS